MDSPTSWEDEAQAVINDIQALVKFVSVSQKLKSDYHQIYLNLITNENSSYCIELSSLGFRIVGEQFDCRTIDSGQYFDTPYALLSQISQSYSQVFANALISKLQNISDSQ